jgi:hypothetical protein
MFFPGLNKGKLNFAFFDYSKPQARVCVSVSIVVVVVGVNGCVKKRKLNFFLFVLMSHNSFNRGKYLLPVFRGVN